MHLFPKHRYACIHSLLYTKNEAKLLHSPLQSNLMNLQILRFYLTGANEGIFSVIV